MRHVLKMYVVVYSFATSSNFAMSMLSLVGVGGMGFDRAGMMTGEEVLRGSLGSKSMLLAFD